MSENSKNLLEYDSIPTYISLTKFKTFLKCLLQTIMDDNFGITKDIFYKLFPYLPYFAKKKLFVFFLNSQNQYKNQISSNYLIDILTKILYGDINYKLEFISNFFLFNNDKLITFEDVRLYFYHFYIFSFKENIISLDIILNNFFLEEKSVNINTFKELIKFHNSDIFFLFYFLLNKCLFNKYDIVFINNKLKIDNSLNDIHNIEILYDFNNILSPSKELFCYINQNYGLNLQYNEHQYSINDDSYEENELEDLIAFENDFKKCRASIITNRNNIEKDNSFRKTSYQSEKILKKKKRIKFFPNSSENILSFHSSSPDSKNYVSRLNTYKHPKKNSLFNFEQASYRREEISNISILINEKIIICEAYYSNSFLLIKYKKNKKNNYLIIPLSFSFPKTNDIKSNRVKKKSKDDNYINGKNNEKEINIDDFIYEVEIVNQTTKKGKNFIFLFPTNSKRNIFYNEIKRFSNYIEIKDKYNLIDQIGKGGFGQIYISTKKLDKLNSLILEKDLNKKNEKYAIKIINKLKKQSNDPNEVFDRNEIEINKILQQLNNPYIIKIYEVLEDIENIYLVMEYCPIAYKESVNFKIQIKVSQITQVIKGIEFLHSIGIMHRDIKPNNILLSEDGYYKIIDFGFADLFSPFEKTNETLGSIGFFPPEILCKKEYSFNVEFWNIGVMAYYYLFNELPYGLNENIQIIKSTDISKIIFNHKNKIENNNIKYIKILEKIILDCLKFDINERGKNLKQILDENLK